MGERLESPDDDRYFDIEGLARYSGMSVRTIRRYIDDPVCPLPTHNVTQSSKDRGKVLIHKREFDAWVHAFPPARAKATRLQPALRSLDEEERELVRTIRRR
jgi:hypothetical protein